MTINEAQELVKSSIPAADQPAALLLLARLRSTPAVTVSDYRGIAVANSMSDLGILRSDSGSYSLGGGNREVFI